MHLTSLPDIEDLEAALQARWCRETLAVYADGLQALGDPRGELIALDLHIEAHGLTPALETTRRERLHAWLGGTHLCGRPWHPELFQFGFLDDLYLANDGRTTIEQTVSAFLASPASGYLRGVEIAAAADGVAEALAMLATREHRWLEYLTITQLAVSRGPVPRPIVEACFAAAPSLHTVRLAGHRILEPTDTRSLRRLELLDLDAIEPGTMPSITELVLALNDPEGPPELERVQSLLAARHLPRLAHLDVSCNEPLPGGAIEVLELLCQLDELDRVKTIVVPSVRTRDQVEALRRLLARAPETRFEIARSYRGHEPVARLVDPRVEQPDCRPWPPMDSLSTRDCVTITIPPDGASTELWLADGVVLLEDNFDAMPAHARAAWTKLWRFLQTDESRFPSATFSAATLLCALEALDDLDLATGTFGPWRAAGELIRRRKLPPGASVTIEHRGTPTFARPHSIAAR